MQNMFGQPEAAAVMADFR